MSSSANGFMFKKLHLLLSLTLCVPLLACTGAVLRSYDDPSQVGLKYFLPKTLVNIEIEPVGYKRTTVVAELSEKEKEAADEVGHVRVQVEIDGVFQTALVDKNGALADDLVIGLNLKLSETGGGGSGPVENVADPHAGLVLQYRPSIMSHDRVCMGTNKKSLLAFVQAQVEDKTGDVIVSLAKAVGRLTGPGAFASTRIAQPIGGRIIKLQIDPLDEWDRKSVMHAINTNFPQFRGQYVFTADQSDYFLPPKRDKLTRSMKDQQICPENHVCYRTRGPLRMTLKNNYTHNKSVVYAKVVNRAVTHKIDVTRAFLVEKITLLKFDDGVLEHVKVKKKSEALAAAKLPLTVYDAVLTSALAAPGRFIGKVTPGLKDEQFDDLIGNYKKNLDAVNDVRASLQKIREGDLTEETDQAEKFQLSCSP